GGQPRRRRMRCMRSRTATGRSSRARYLRPRHWRSRRPLPHPGKTVATAAAARRARSGAAERKVRAPATAALPLPHRATAPTAARAATADSRQPSTEHKTGSTEQKEGTVKDYQTAVRWPGVASGLGVAAALAVACTAVGGAAGAAGAGLAGGTPPSCPAPSTPAKKPTTITTIGQAYSCTFKHYYAGPVLDDRVLLEGAFAGLTQQLDRLGLDQPDATMPALTGHRARDWEAFAAVYRRIIGRMPARKGLRQQVAAATMTGMVATLHDNHAGWSYPEAHPPPGENYGLGITTSP